MKALSLLLLTLLFIISCTDRGKLVDKSQLIGSDYRLFQDTPAWELAKAVQDGNTNKIDNILRSDPKLINYQEPKYGNTLLMLTVMNQQIKPFKYLLGNKADVNVHNTYDGTSALIEACTFKEYDEEYAEMLLQYGANVNDLETGERIQENTTRNTPLMAASKSGRVDLVKLLTVKGADINFQNEYKHTALGKAVMQDNYEVAIYLLKNGANYKHPVFVRPGDSADYNLEDDAPMYLVNVLREDFINLESEEYKYKMQIVEFLKSQGVDYRSTPIPEYIKRKAQNEYPNGWQEYLAKY